jgi:hypothetical protein
MKTRGRMGSWLLLERRGRGREVEGTFVVFAGSWRKRREVAKARGELSLRVLLSLKMLLYKRREDMVGKVEVGCSAVQLGIFRCCSPV